MWKPEDYYIPWGRHLDTRGARTLAPVVFNQTCRFNLTAPGFTLIDLGPRLGSRRLRRSMVGLQRELRQVLRATVGQDLIYLSMGRYAGLARAESLLAYHAPATLLMLGYEPSEVDSALRMTDYTKFAYELGLEPARLLESRDHDEPFPAQYVTDVGLINPAHAQILLVNCNRGSIRDDELLGVLHHTELRSASSDDQCVVNAATLAVAAPGAREPVTREQQKAFVQSDDVL